MTVRFAADGFDVGGGGGGISRPQRPQRLYLLILAKSKGEIKRVEMTL